MLYCLLAFFGERALLDLSGVSMRFGARTLFEGVDWHVAPGEKVGLLGDNGVGKTTLLRIIDRQLAPEGGRISMPAGFRTGYLPQAGIEPSARTLHEEALQAFGDINALKARLEELQFEIDHSCDPDPALLNRYADTGQQLRAFDVDRMEPRIHEVLTGLGFGREEFGRPLAEFSGGWQMRAALARLLLSSPDIMLLDEPTNYLDIEARVWLAEFLRECPRCVIMVCHDRHFLDRTVQRVADLENRTLTDYFTNYSGYVREKLKRMELLHATRARQEKELARQKRFIERFRYKARKASQVQSRIKQLARFKLVEVPHPAGSIHVVIPAPERSGLAVLALEGASAGYGARPVFSGVNLDVRRGDRLALVGPNGAGKSTLMAVLAGRKALDGGTRREGHNVVLGYFEQESAQLLDGSLTVLQTAEVQAPAEFRPQLRGLLGAFGFSGDDVYKKVEVLSGGERSRLALLALLLSRPNVLLLDEPTNHLDMKTKDVLLAALRRFGGTVVFVSHDRYFMNQLSTRVVEIGAAHITDYPGDYEHFLWRKSKQQETLADKLPEEKEHKTPSAGKLAWQKKKKLAARRRKAQKKAKALQEKTAELEARLAEIEKSMEQLYSSGRHVEAAQVAQSQAALKKELEESYSEWEQVENEIANLSGDEGK